MLIELFKRHEGRKPLHPYEAGKTEMNFGEPWESQIALEEREAYLDYYDRLVLSALLSNNFEDECNRAYWIDLSRPADLLWL